MALTKVLNLFTSAQRTASFDSSIVPTGIVTKPLIQNTAKDVTRHARVLIDVSVVTAGTVDFALQGRATKTAAWATLAPTTAFTSVTVAGVVERRFEGPLPPELKLVSTYASATITSSANIVLGG